MLTKRIAITGMGIISALGDSPECLHSALCHGESGLHPVEENAFEYPINRWEIPLNACIQLFVMAKADFIRLKKTRLNIP